MKLTSKATEALKSHLERQLAEIDRVGSLWSPGDADGLIFASETGEPLDRRAVTKVKFKPLLNRAGLPKIRFHDLRHTCATLLLTHNVNPKIVSEMLGHSSVAITLDTYSHVLPNMRDQAAAAMEEAFRSLLLSYCCQSPRSRCRGLCGARGEQCLFADFH